MKAVQKHLHLKIAKDFTETPGPRFRIQGPYSGEAFREEVLNPRFKEAIEQQAKLLIDLDGGYGYGTSFLEEAFGGLARIHKDSGLVLSTLEFKSDEEPALLEKIPRYIREAND